MLWSLSDRYRRQTSRGLDLGADGVEVHEPRLEQHRAIASIVSFSRRLGARPCAGRHGLLVHVGDVAARMIGGLADAIYRRTKAERNLGPGGRGR